MGGVGCGWFHKENQWMDPGLMAQIQSLIFAGKKMVTKRVDF